MTQHVKIVIVSDNCVFRPGLLAEHGFAAWVEADGFRLLFDTGQGMALVHNAGELHLPLETLGAVVLSHGHYDHTGGLAAVLARSPSARLYLHPAAARAKFARSQGPPHRAIGMPAEARAALERAAGRVIRNTAAVEIAAGVIATGEIPRRRPAAAEGGRFFLDPECRTPDLFADEQALLIRTPAGLVVVTGCAHAGLPATLEWCRLLGGGLPVHAVFGGFHLAAATEAELEGAAAALEESGAKVIGACHCTGARGRDFLRSRFPSLIPDIGCGTVWELPADGTASGLKAS
jgi:7,8-dihydropterin-6-yl-methyl-4-(beta-D-ribofuranosyl)aminobenzene 5'-phosphate synthase